MYWDEHAALLDDAYTVEQQTQYFFGRDLIVAPVTSQVDNKTGTVSKSIWLPPSASSSAENAAATGVQWYDWNTMAALGVGPARTPLNTYGLGDIPIVVRGGAGTCLNAHPCPST